MLNLNQNSKKLLPDRLQVLVLPRTVQPNPFVKAVARTHAEAHIAKIFFRQQLQVLDRRDLLLIPEREKPAVGNPVASNNMKKDRPNERNKYKKKNKTGVV